MTRYAELILSRPLLLGVALTPPAKNGPPVCAFAIVDAGDRKAELTAAVSKLEVLVGPGHDCRSRGWLAQDAERQSLGGGPALLGLGRTTASSSP